MVVVLLLLGLLPASKLKNLLLTTCGRGWSVARSARVQPSLLWRVGQLRVGDRADVGPGNVFRELSSVDLGEGVQMGQFNWFSGAAAYIDQVDPDLAGRLVMEDRSGLTSRHYVDCSGGVRIGMLALVAGVRSTILTHSVNHRTWRQEGRPVHLGRSSVLFSNALVTAGTVIAERSVVAGGAVVSGHLAIPERLYGGVPAVEIGDISGAAALDREQVRDAPREELDRLRRARRSGRSDG